MDNELSVMDSLCYHLHAELQCDLGGFIGAHNMQMEHLRLKYQ